MCARDENCVIIVHQMGHILCWLCHIYEFFVSTKKFSHFWLALIFYCGIAAIFFAFFSLIDYARKMNMSKLCWVNDNTNVNVKDHKTDLKYRRWLELCARARVCVLTWKWKQMWKAEKIIAKWKMTVRIKPFYDEDFNISFSYLLFFFIKKKKYFIVVVFVWSFNRGRECDWNWASSHGRAKHLIIIHSNEIQFKSTSF